MKKNGTMISISPDKEGFEKEGLATAVAAYGRIFTATGRNMGDDVKQWLLYLYGPTDLDGDGATGEANDAKEKFDMLRKIIIKLNQECLDIISSLKFPWDAQRGILPDELVAKQKLIGDAVERREAILEKYRCDRVVREFESLHPPTLWECPTCFTDAPQWDFAFNECCGKATCNSCSRYGELSGCPLCRHTTTIDNIREVNDTDNIHDANKVSSINSIQDVKDITKFEDTNSATAQHSMGIYLLNGQGPFHRDVKEGQKMTLTNDEQGISTATHELALIHDGCDGIITDGEKVVRYTEEAARTGFPLAQWRMAELLMTGRFGARKDENEVIKYLTLAAQGGCEIAQGHLGSKFVATGQLERAKYWLEKATRAENFEIRSKYQTALAGIVVNLATKVYWSRHGLCRPTFEERPSNPPQEKDGKKKIKNEKPMALLKMVVKRGERKPMALFRKIAKKADGRVTGSQRTENICKKQQKYSCYPWSPQLETATRIVTYWKSRRLFLKLQASTPRVK